MLPQLIPAIVFCSLAATLLLGFIAWRLVRCCGARCSVRRSKNRAETAGAADSGSDGGGNGVRRKKRRRRSGDPLDVLHGRAYWAIKICAVLLMGGVIAGAALGIAAVDPPLVQNGREAFKSMKDYINSAVQVANATVAQLQMLDSWALAVQVRRCKGMSIAPFNWLEIHNIACTPQTHRVISALAGQVEHAQRLGSCGDYSGPGDGMFRMGSSASTAHSSGHPAQRACPSPRQTIQSVHDTIQGNLDSVRSAVGYIQVQERCSRRHF